MNVRNLAWLLALPLIIGTMSSATSAASPIALPPDSMIVTPGGVDLMSGAYKTNKTVLSIGPDQIGGIEFRRLTRSYGIGEFPGRIAQFNHNWDIRFKRKARTGGTDVIVTSDELSYTFLDTGTSTATLTSNTAYATLTRATVGSSYFYTLVTADGTSIVSRAVDTAVNGITMAASVTRANGVRYILSYDTMGPSGASRLRNVSSNAGYALLLEYYPNSGTNYFISKACVVNIAVTFVSAAGTCPTGASTANYVYTGQVLTSETDPTGAVWTFTSTYVNQNSAFQETYTIPGASTPYLTLNYDYVENFKIALTSQTLADGRVYEYGWQLFTSQDGTPIALLPSYYQEDTGSVNVGVDLYRYSVYAPPRIAPGLSQVSTGGRTTTFDWCLQTCAYAMLKSKILPEGIKASYTYDSYHNLIQTVFTPKPDSPLGSITTSAAFDCSSMTSCNKPIYTVDGNGYQTDNSYDPIHGGILSVTKPAVGGIRPQTRYVYAQRFAWIASGAGGYVQTATPVWLLASESFCRISAASGAGCTLVGDEVTTTYDYGPSSGPNTLLLRGRVISADGLSLRTCYSYDVFGRKISETTPNANLGSCP